MKSITLLMLASGLVALGACSRDTAEELQANVEDIGVEIKETVTQDPDIAEAGDAIEGVVEDGGDALKQVASEARKAREAKPEAQNVDESQESR